jgi:hypothetical protein
VATLLKNADGTYATQAACAGPNATTPHALRAAFPYLTQIDLAYHYMIFSHFSTCDSNEDCTVGCPPDHLEASECTLFAEQPGFGTVGSAEILGDDGIVSLGRFTDAARPIPLETWSGTIMHELGHNLGLFHGGAACTNYDPNYVSVMNYWFTQHGIPVAASPGSIVPQACTTDTDCAAPAHCSTGAGGSNTCYRIDYSSVQLSALNKSALDETTGLNAGPGSTDITYYFACGGACSLPAPTNGSPIDWNNDGDATQTGVAADINNDGSTRDFLSGQNDWAQSGGVFTNLTFSFQTTPGFSDDLIIPRDLRFGKEEPIVASAKPTFEQLFQDYWLMAARKEPARSAKFSTVLIPANSPRKRAPQNKPHINFLLKSRLF